MSNKIVQNECNQTTNIKIIHSFFMESYLKYAFCSSNCFFDHSVFSIPFSLGNISVNSKESFLTIADSFPRKTRYDIAHCRQTGCFITFSDVKLNSSSTIYCFPPHRNIKTQLGMNCSCVLEQTNGTFEYYLDGLKPNK